MLAEQFDHVDFHALAGMGPDAHDATALPDGGDAVEQAVAADHVVREIHAQAIGQAHDRLSDIRQFVIDHLVCAKFAGRCELLVGPGSSGRPWRRPDDPRFSGG